MRPSISFGRSRNIVLVGSCHQPATRVVDANELDLVLTARRLSTSHRGEW